VLQQLLGADDGAVRGQQHLQDAELLAGQRQRLPSAGRPVPRAVDGQVPVPDHRRSRRRPASQGAHACDQLGERERLAEVVVGAQFQAVDPVVDRRRRGQQEDPGGGVGHQGPADVVSVHHRQVSIEHDHVVRGIGRAGQRRRPVVDDVDRHPGIAQALADPGGQRDVVLDHQHAHPVIVPLRR
jgi:hypothetical protein